jgi:hypothetical protein
MARVERHHQLFDWCHICGVRSDWTADVWYPKNAEHGGPSNRYIRICAPCAKHIAAKATERSCLQQDTKDAGVSWRSAWAICMAAYKKKMRRQGKKGKS